MKQMRLAQAYGMGTSQMIGSFAQQSGRMFGRINFPNFQIMSKGIQGMRGTMTLIDDQMDAYAYMLGMMRETVLQRALKIKRSKDEQRNIQLEKFRRPYDRAKVCTEYRQAGQGRNRRG